MNMTSFGTVASITLRALFGRRRFLLLLPLPLLVIGLAALGNGSRSSARRRPNRPRAVM